MTTTHVSRREMIGAASAAGAGAATLARRASGEADRASRSDSPDLANATTAGVAYFRKRCEDQLPLARGLLDAVRSGDLRAAQRAYIDARPPYEEIETTALAFEGADRDIDARPYAFSAGENDPEFRGFHKIEALLFGYQDTAEAVPYAEQLVKSVERLRRELAERDRFDSGVQFDGMIALATEVAAKKISSEEETWSDQSLLIFRHNWIGVFSQFAPFARLLDDRTSERVKDAHGAAMALVEPHFAPGEAAGTPYSKIRTRERRAMADASNALRDALLAARESLGV